MRQPGQSIWRRLAGVLLILLGVLGLILSVVGVAGSWVGRAYAIRHGTKLVDKADSLLAMAADVLGRVKDSLIKARAELAAAPQPMPDAPRPAPQKPTPRQLSLGSLVGWFFPELENAGRTLEAVAAGSVILDSLLQGLNETPLVEKTSLDSQQLQEVAGRVKGLGASAQRLRALLGDDSADNRQIEEQAAQIEHGIAEAIAAVEDLGSHVARAQAQVAAVQARLAPTLTLAAGLLTVFFAWFALGQVSLILHGAAAWRRGGPPASPPLTS